MKKIKKCILALILMALYSNRVSAYTFEPIANPSVDMFPAKKKIVFGGREDPLPFRECDKLRDVYFKSTKVDKSIKGVFSPKTTLHVPPSAVKKYQKITKCKVVPWKRR